MISTPEERLGSLLRLGREEATRALGEAGADRFRFELPEGEDAVLALDVRACPITRFAKEHGAPEIVPMICRIDELVASKLVHLELRRTGTIAMGATHCDFRYVKKNQ